MEGLGPGARLSIGVGIVLLGGVFCPMLSPATVVGGAVTIELLKAFASVAAGTTANAGDVLFGKKPTDPVSLENHDLTKVVGKAIATAIRETAQDKKNQQNSKDLDKIATYTEHNWVKIARERFTQENYSQLREANLDQLLTPEEYRLTQEGNLSVPDWENIFTDLCESYKSSKSSSVRQDPAFVDPWCGVVGDTPIDVTPDFQLLSNVSSDIAKSLHEKFPKALRDTFKQDFKQERKAFARLILNLLTKMKAEIEKQGNQQTVEFTQILDRINKLEPQLKGTNKEIQEFFTDLSRGIDVNLANISEHLVRMEGKQDENLAISKEILELLKSSQTKGATEERANDQKYRNISPIKQVLQALENNVSLLRIKGIKGSGKTWLLENVIIPEAKRKGYLTVSLDFRKSPNLNGFELNKKLEELLKWLCKQIQKELGLNLDLNGFWDKMDDPKSNATNYLEQIFSKIDGNILLIGLDEIENIFNNPSISIDFCDLLRGWAEESSRNNRNSHLWKQVRIVVLHSREKYAQLDINSSPLAGAGRYISLNEFTENQINALINHYQLNWSQDDLNNLLVLVGGYFDLINHAFKEAKEQNLTAEQIIHQASTDQSIYGNHLRSLLKTLNNKPDLKATFKTVIESTNPVNISDSVQVFHLESMGLVKLNGDLVSPRCELYRQYFKSRI